MCGLQALFNAINLVYPLPFLNTTKSHVHGLFLRAILYCSTQHNGTKDPLWQGSRGSCCAPHANGGLELQRF